MEIIRFLPKESEENPMGRKRQLKMQPVGVEHLTQYNQLLRYVFQVTDQELKSAGKKKT